MALQLTVCGIISTLIIHFSLIHSLNGQVASSNISVQQVNYVTPNKSMPCLKDQQPCFTINQYASHIDKSFLDNSIFSFIPGNHSLNFGINISGINNVSFIGLPNNSVTIVILNETACIMCERCENIEFTNIIFIIESNLICALSFESTFFVKLSNIIILGNSYLICSSVIIKKSIVNIGNSTFDGMTGYYGSALIASRSTITFVGNNSFHGI